MRRLFRILLLIVLTALAAAACTPASSDPVLSPDEPRAAQPDEPAAAPVALDRKPQFLNSFASW